MLCADVLLKSVRTCGCQRLMLQDVSALLRVYQGPLQSTSLALRIAGSVGSCMHVPYVPHCCRTVRTCPSRRICRRASDNDTPSVVAHHALCKCSKCACPNSVAICQVPFAAQFLIIHLQTSRRSIESGKLGHGVAHAANVSACLTTLCKIRSTDLNMGSGKSFSRRFGTRLSKAFLVDSWLMKGSGSGACCYYLMQQVKPLSNFIEYKTTCGRFARQNVKSIKMVVTQNPISDLLDWP